MKLPDKVQYIITQLEKAGYEGYAVGGCVRDTLLHRNPDDWDITTSATPIQVKRVFGHTIDTGIAHGTVTVLLQGEGFEVTTYRIDGEYEDSRHPKEVVFTASLIEDLKRRDFTINAMAYNDRTGIVDVFHGIKDLEQGIIRCVGDPRERFSEDALRLMRAVRFAAQLGYIIEPATKEAIRELAPSIANISAERICTELVKLVVSGNPQDLRIAYETGITAVILPEFDQIMKTAQNNPHHCYSVGEHTLKAMEACRPRKELRLAMLFHDFGKAQTRTTDKEGIDHFHGHARLSCELTEMIMKRLKFDNETLRKVSKLVKYHDLKIEETPAAIRKAIVTMGTELFPLLLEVKEADFLAQSNYKRREKEEELEHLTAIYEEVRKAGDCVTLKELAVTGNDLMQAGMKPGREMGELLNKMLEEVLKEPTKNNRAYLMSLLP